MQFCCLRFHIQLGRNCAYSSDLHHSAQILQQPVLGRATLKISIDTLCARWFEQHTADPALQNVGLIESSTAWDIVSKLRSTFSHYQADRLVCCLSHLGELVPNVYGLAAKCTAATALLPLISSPSLPAVHSRSLAKQCTEYDIAAVTRRSSCIQPDDIRQPLR